MALSPALLDRVEAALPQAGETGLAARAIHDRVGRFNRTTVRHALRELVRQGRAGFSGIDRHRRYRRFAPGAAPSEPVSAPRRKATPKAKAAWRGYGARGEGGVILPDAGAVAAAMRAGRVRYRDVDAAALMREERLAGWSMRPRGSAELTRAVFGDPAPGRGSRRFTVRQ
jgi:hypothetical protein